MALGLIGTAGVASAEDAAPAPSDEEATVVTAAQEEEAEIGDGPLFIERPAPRPDPGNELRSDATPSPAPAPAPTPAPAPAPAAPATSGGASPAAQTTAAATPANLIPARATEVRGAQIVRGATAAPSSPESVALARTGVDTGDLTVLAGALLVLGALLIRTSRLRRHTI